jgi:hypothetical protein
LKFSPAINHEQSIFEIANNPLYFIMIYLNSIVEMYKIDKNFPSYLAISTLQYGFVDYIGIKCMYHDVIKYIYYSLTHSYIILCIHYRSEDCK